MRGDPRWTRVTIGPLAPAITKALAKDALADE